MLEERMANDKAAKTFNKKIKELRNKNKAFVSKGAQQFIKLYLIFLNILTSFFSFISIDFNRKSTCPTRKTAMLS